MKKLLSYVLILILCLTAFTGCSQPKEDEDLLAAKNYLMGMYKDKDETTPSDYDVIGVVMVGTTKYDVEWTVDVKEGVTIVDKDTMVTIDVNEQTPTEIAYKLTATVKNAKGQTASVSFSRKVPAYKESGFADYAGAEDGANVVVKGIISGIIAKSKGNSSNCLYVQSLSGDGGYYVYGLAADPVTDGKLEVGMTVQVTGTKTTYNGTLEIENATVEVVEATNELKPVDITDIFKNAKALDDAALAGPQAMLVTIKGVEITGQNKDSGYYKFKLGELETYVRVSSSVCPLTKDEQTAFIEGHSSHTGWIADVTGVICVYNGAFYLTPVSADAFVYLNEAEKSDADKVAAEKENLSLKSEITSNTTLDLTTAGASFDDVKIAWASDNACAVVEDGKLVITLPAEAATVKVTATLTCGDAKDTREFTVNVAAAPVGNYVTTPVDTPVAGTAYKLYLTQVNLGQTLYFTGEMNGNYLAAADRADMGVDVYLEAVDGGFRLYFNKDGAKQYINLYEYTAGKVGVQITAEPTAVFTWNTEAKTLVANVAGGDYYMGTYKTFSTFSASSLSYITGDKASSIGVSNFPSGLCTVAVEGGTGNDDKEPSTENKEPSTEGQEPSTEDKEPSTEDKEPSTEVPPTEAPKPELTPVTTLESGTYVIWAPGYNVALSSTYGGYYNSSVAVSKSGDTLTGYGSTEVWTVTKNSDGTYTISCDDGKLSMDAEFTSMPLNKANDTWVLYDAGNGCYYVQNVGRGNYIEYYANNNNWSAYYEIGEGSEAMFALQFIPAEAIAPDPEPSPVTTLESGNYVIWVPAYNMALSSEKAGYYNAGVPVTANGSTLSGYTETEIWTVTKNSDGTYYISQGGQNLSLADSYSSMNLGETHDKWLLFDAGNGCYYIQNAGRENYMEWYADYSNWSTYGSISSSSEGMFIICFTAA